MKDVICSFASKGREPYNQYLLRLIDSALQHWHGDLLIYSPDHHLESYRGVKINKGWPQPEWRANYTLPGYEGKFNGIINYSCEPKSYVHSEMPYQFKTSMVQLALEMGYKRIIWLDSSMILKRDISELLNNCKTGVFAFHNLGHDTWKYLSDNATEKLGINEETLKSVKQIWGGAFGLDFTKSYTQWFFSYLVEYSNNGSFKDSGSTRNGFVAHRHDQSVMSVLLSQTGKLKLHYRHPKLDSDYFEFKWNYDDMLPYGHILCPPHDTTGEYGTDPYLVCRGL